MSVPSSFFLRCSKQPIGLSPVPTWQGHAVAVVNVLLSFSSRTFFKHVVSAVGGSKLFADVGLSGGWWNVLEGGWVLIRARVALLDF